MTKLRLTINVSIVMGLLGSLILLAVVFKYYKNNADFYGAIKDFSSIIVAIAAVYLAYCFQRRQNFLNSLNELWHEIVCTKTDIMAYLDNESADEASYTKACRALSETIDLVRGVYKNVGESDRHVGLYPFEPLHDMRRSLEGLRGVKITPERREAERKTIDRAWNALRFAFLDEFSRPYPPSPILEQVALDPRRNKDQSALRRVYRRARRRM